MQGYIKYYNSFRPHQGLKGIPNAPPEEGSKTGAIRQTPLLFGLHNHYYRETGVEYEQTPLIQFSHSPFEG